MPDEIWPSTPPQRILLATDLSARGDRALDRATQLALRWGAELLVVHAVEEASAAEHGALPSWRRPPNIVDTLDRQIRADVRGDCPRLRVLVEEGPATRVVLEAVEREKCDLVIVGQGRARPLGFTTLSKTIDDLFRRSPVSVLIVKQRPREPYRHILVGTDLTPESRRGLEVAAQMFPDAMFVLMNAFELPYRALLQDTQLGSDFGVMERAALHELVAEAALPDKVRTGVLTLIEHGPAEVMLSTYVNERQADLTVIGAYERSRLFHVVVRGNGPGIVEAVPSDVLVVRAERGSASPEP